MLCLTGSVSFICQFILSRRHEDTEFLSYRCTFSDELRAGKLDFTKNQREQSGGKGGLRGLSVSVRDYFTIAGTDDDKTFETKPWLLLQYESRWAHLLGAQVLSRSEHIDMHGASIECIGKLPVLQRHGS